MMMLLNLGGRWAAAARGPRRNRSRIYDVEGYDGGTWVGTEHRYPKPERLGDKRGPSSGGWVVEALLAGKGQRGSGDLRCLSCRGCIRLGPWNPVHEFLRLIGCGAEVSSICSFVGSEEGRSRLLETAVAHLARSACARRVRVCLLPLSRKLVTMPAPVVDSAYRKNIEKLRRDLRAFIAEKNCAPLMVRLGCVTAPVCSIPFALADVSIAGLPSYFWTA